MITVWIAIFIMSCESVIKQVRETNGQENEHIPILKDKLYLTKHHNRGAFLNMGQKYPDIVKGVSIGLCLACTVIFLATLGRKGKALLKLGLSVLLGGAYSNTYDRLTRGYVVDYFGFEAKNEKIKNVVFNISDFCIIIGAALTILGV